MANQQEFQQKTFSEGNKRYLSSADGEVTDIDAWAIEPMESGTQLAGITDSTIADANSKMRLLAVTSLAAAHFGNITAVQVASGTICVHLR